MREAARWGGRPAALLGAVGVAALGLGCGGAPPPEPAIAEAPEREVGDLGTLAPADATLVIRARPAELVGSPPTARVVDALFPAERLDGFEARTGVDLRALTELVFVVHPEGRVAFARGPFDAELAVMEAGARMAPAESATDRPFPRRAGFLGPSRIELAAPAPDVVVWIDGPPTLAAEVLAACARPEEERDHPFERGEVSEVVEALGVAPFLAAAPQPLGLPRDSGVGMLLARERALGIAVSPVGEGELEVRAELRGEFPPGSEENFRALARSVAESDLGGVSGLREALPTLTVDATPTEARASARVPAQVLAVGLRALLVASIEELLASPPTPRLPGDDAPAASETEAPSAAGGGAPGGAHAPAPDAGGPPPTEGATRPPAPLRGPGPDARAPTAGGGSATPPDPARTP